MNENHLEFLSFYVMKAELFWVKLRRKEVSLVHSVFPLSAPATFKALVNTV